MTGETDITELNGQINRMSTSGYKNSDEYEVIRKMVGEMIDLEGSFVFGSNWFIPLHFKRQKKSVIDKARKGNLVRFRQNYLLEWVGASDGALLNISKLMKLRTLIKPELSCPRDKNKNFEINEYIFGVDVARSNSESNNKTSIIILKLVRNNSGTIRQIQLVNIVSPPNGLNFKEQSIIIKRLFYLYGGNLDINKSRVKAIVIDGNVIGRGLIDRLLEEVTDNETNEELGCFATINTTQKPETANAPKIIYDLTAQGINGDIITHFLNYVESGKLKLLKSFEDVKPNIKTDDIEQEVLAESACVNTQLLLDEVANLRL
jgi:ribonucleoside-diphosphate reductase alpha chain